MAEESINSYCATEGNSFMKCDVKIDRTVRASCNGNGFNHGYGVVDRDCLYFQAAVKSEINNTKYIWKIR